MAAYRRCSVYVPRFSFDLKSIILSDELVESASFAAHLIPLTIPSPSLPQSFPYSRAGKLHGSRGAHSQRHQQLLQRGAADSGLGRRLPAGAEAQILLHVLFGSRCVLGGGGDSSEGGFWVWTSPISCAPRHTSTFIFISSHPLSTSRRGRAAGALGGALQRPRPH